MPVNAPRKPATRSSGSVSDEVPTADVQVANRWTSSIVVHADTVSTGIARKPNRTKNPNMASAAAVIWIAWEKSATRPMLNRCRTVGRSIGGPAPSSRRHGEEVGGDVRIGRGDDLVPPVERVQRPHQRRHPRQQEHVAHHEERRQGEPVHRSGERAGDLPDLGVDEQERLEQQQQRQGPDDHVEEHGDLGLRACSPPSRAAGRRRSW